MAATGELDERADAEETAGLILKGERRYASERAGAADESGASPHRGQSLTTELLYTP